MREFLLAMSPVIAIWVMLIGPVIYLAIRGVLRALARAFSGSRITWLPGAGAESTTVDRGAST